MIRRILIAAAAVVVAGASWLSPISAQQQTPPPVPVPRPFPGAVPPPTPTPTPTSTPTPTPPRTAPVDSRQGASRPATPATSPAAPVPPPAGAQLTGPSEVLQSVKVPPTAEYLESFDTGKGQRYYIFGTNDSYADVVAYFKTQIRGGSRELFKTPGMFWFDLPGRVTEASFPPSVVVKDYTWGTLDGYLFVDGASSKRFKTIIQIVPAGR